MGTTTQIIAKEGWKPIIIALVILFFCWLVGWKFIGFLAFLALICFVYFYYNPERIPQDLSENSILAPIDGKIVNIENQHDGIYLEIKKPICFCGMIRMPFEGEAKEKLMIQGLYNGKEATGEKIILDFKGVCGDSSLVLYPKICLRNVYLYFFDSKFRMGQRIGFFLNGRAKFKLPANVEIKVSIDDRIYAGSSVIGYVR